MLIIFIVQLFSFVLRIYEALKLAKRKTSEIIDQILLILGIRFVVGALIRLDLSLEELHFRFVFSL